MSKLVTIEFDNDTLFAVERPDGIFVALKPIVDALGIDWKAQRNRIDRTPVLAKGRVVMTLPSPGGPQEQVCLRLDLLNGWLFGIDAERVSPEARPHVVAYQERCFAVLHEHFFGRRGEGVAMTAIPSAEPARDEPVSVRRGLVTEARQTFGARAAGSLWFRLGLPIVPEMREGSPPDLFTYTAVRRDGPSQSQGDR